jgi:hypothetical protein
MAASLALAGDLLMDDLATIPIEDLARLIRERESVGDFGPETTALRVALECRRAGLPIKE